MSCDCGGVQAADNTSKNPTDPVEVLIDMFSEVVS